MTENDLESVTIDDTFVVSHDDNAIIHRFLMQKLRSTGSGTMKAYLCALRAFFSFMKKATISDITDFDVEDYLNHLDQQNLSLATKRNRRAYLKGFFDYYQKMIRRNNPTYYNPIPNQKDYKFSVEKPLSIAEQQRIIQEQCYTPTQLIQILKTTHLFNKAYFIQVLLLTFCGMRVSECVSIRIENINLRERYLKTGMEENARKSNHDGTTPLYFCFPEQVTNLLFYYIQEVKENNPNAEWLFPGSDRVSSKVRNLQRFLDTLHFQFPVRPHSFRRTLETFQLNLTNRVPLYVVEMLSNHKISSVVMNNYNKVTIHERVKFYDESFPKEYIPILIFLESL